MVRKIGYLLSIVVIIFSQSTWAEESSRLSSTEKFVVLADIHFDPFFACAALPKPCSIVTKLRRVDSEQWDTILANNTGEIAGFGEDTNYALLQLVLVELQKINQINQPQFILILGDFLAHSFHEKYIKYSGDTSNTGYTLFVKKTLQFLTYRLNQIFPNVSIYPAVGNNDTYTENYNVVPNGLFLQDTAITWSSGIKNEKNKNSFLQVFPKNGYYAITLAHKQKILVLNTVLFSSKSRKKDMAIAANNQLQWLKQQLLVAKKEHFHVIIVCHIPMGVDALTSIKLYLFSMHEFWKPAYSSEFKKILFDYSSTITAILPAHIHMDAYQIIPIINIPVIFTPSISPIYGNSPGFKLFFYDPNTLNIKDYITYSSEWSPNGMEWVYNAKEPTYADAKNIIK